MNGAYGVKLLESVEVDLSIYFAQLKRKNYYLKLAKASEV